LKTPLFELVEAKLGDDLSWWITACRRDEMTYADIATHIEELTGVTVGRSTVHEWAVAIGL